MSRDLLKRIKEAAAGMNIIIPKQPPRREYKFKEMGPAHEVIVIDSIGGPIGGMYQHWVDVLWPCGRKLKKPAHADCSNPECIAQRIHEE